MSRKIILIKQELLLLVYELNRSGLLAENEKIRPILARSEERFSRNAETDHVCRLLLEKKNDVPHASTAWALPADDHAAVLPACARASCRLPGARACAGGARVLGAAARAAARYCATRGL